MLAHAVDYGLRPVDYASQCSLWISQPCGLGRIYPWLTPLWIRGLRRSGGWLRPHTPQAGLSPARFASCGCSFGAHKATRIRGA